MSDRDRLRKDSPNVADLLDAVDRPRRTILGGGASTQGEIDAAASAATILRRVNAARELRHAERLNAEAAAIETMAQGEGESSSSNS
jgi:hypothetical protein